MWRQREVEREERDREIQEAEREEREREVAQRERELSLIHI